ncbi:hypothetical protein FO014_14195 [Serratia rhizosphaerae]|uniref:HTH-like domain-containing protein n=1 Tax=Serratia rhizosphaerae TaxID=2597702 RepID=A0ABX6GP06_9GAMM|nr:hypothetical protein FO014_14195 [Serratia rhizosphaerae]
MHTSGNVQRYNGFCGGGFQLFLCLILYFLGGRCSRRSSKKVPRPVQKSEEVSWLLEAYRIGLRRGCRLMMQSRTLYHYQGRRDDRAITQRIHILLHREGWLINHKKTHRIHSACGGLRPEQFKKQNLA